MNKTKLVIALFLCLGGVLAARAQVQVFVPANASGHFGIPSDQVIPLVPALVVNGPGTVTVTYVSGLVTWDSMGDSTGPEGSTCNSGCAKMQFPLHEARGLGQMSTANNVGALMGVFVPESRASLAGFTAIDGTKNATRVGILPNTLFLIGTSKSFDVPGAGTIFLGINDTLVFDNSGGFTVEVSGP